MRVCLALILLLLTGPAVAAELMDVRVERNNGVYEMQSTVRFDAPLSALYEVFRDWDLSKQFSSIIVESRNVAPDETGRPRYYSKYRTCIAFFCKSVERNGYVEEKRNEFIRATVIPEKSDFHLCDETWQFRVEDGYTIVDYELRVQPKFWVPPVIGPWLVKRKLERDGVDALMRIDSVALKFVGVNE